LSSSRTNLKARTGLIAGAATMALLALPGIANAAVTSAFDPGTGALTATVTAATPLTITCVGGDVKLSDGTNTTNPGGGMGTVDCEDVKSITVTGDDAANTINLEGVAAEYSALTSVLVNAGDGVDTIIGSQHADRLVGQRGNDIVSGRGGNDTIVWNGGEGDDENNGEDGVDTIEVNGAGVAETFTVKPDATLAGRIRFDRVLPTSGPAPFFLNIGTSEVLDLNMNAGNDTVTADAGLDALGFKLDVDGAAGEDNIDGSDAADILKGGPDNDTITPDDNPLNTRDVARGEAGNDLIIWNGGDDNDDNDGGEGTDTSRVNGATASETFTVNAGAPGHVLFARVPPTPNPPGFFDIDMTTTEVMDLNMNAGDDTVTSIGAIAPFSLDVDGGPGLDNIDGGDGADILDGGDDNDTIVPDDNPAGTQDVARGGNGNDTITWNGGDDDDINDGGDGNDTSVINGATAAERFTIKPGATAGRVQFDRTSTNPAPFSVDIGTTELLRLNANDGDDVIKGFAGLNGLIETELNGEGDDDRIRGTDAEDRINAGKGHDIVNSIDKAEDLLDCGSGLDLALVDRRDFLRNCNIVIGGLLRVKAPKSAVVSDNGVAALRLKCAGTKKCKGVARLRSGGKTLGSARFNIKSGKKTVQLKLNGKGKRLMANASKKHAVKLQIDAKDSNGNGWRSTSRLTLK